MFAELRSRLAATAVIIGMCALLAPPAGATALYAAISGTFEALTVQQDADWAQLTAFDVGDLTTGGTFTGLIYIDKVVAGDDIEPAGDIATFDPPRNNPSHTLGSFITLELQIGDKVFKGGLEPFGAAAPLSVDEKLRRTDGGTAGATPGDDTLTFATAYSGAEFADGSFNERSLDFTFLGLQFEDALPDVVTPPDLSQLLASSSVKASVSSSGGPGGDKSVTLNGTITQAVGLKTLAQILNEAAPATGGGAGQSGAGTVEDPLLPGDEASAAEGVYKFAIGGIGLFGNGTETPIFIDPDVAIGYEYEVSSGPNFASVQVPVQGLSDSIYTLLFGDDGVGGFLHSQVITAGGPAFDFTSVIAAGVNKFRIVDIDPTLGLSPSSVDAFITGLTYVPPTTGSAVSEMTMTALTTFIDDSVTVPEPGTLSLSAVGLVALWRIRRRRRLH